ADGTGHSLILAKSAGDPEEASTWAPSTLIGGTPGEPDETQVEPEDPTLVTLVDIGHAGRYFKGTKEPSAGTTAWTGIGFNDATTDWLDGDSGYGYSNESDETQWIRKTLDDMNGGYISAYARLRFVLTAEQLESFTELRAEVHYDDGYVLYLNGTKVAGPVNLTGVPPAYSQPAGTASDYSADNVDLTGFLSLLVVGTNVLSIQFHNSATSGSSDCLGSPVLRAVLEPEPGGGDDIRARLVINELLANSDSPPGIDWIELYNPGPIAVDLNNVYLSDGRFDLLQYEIPDGIVLQPGEFWTITEGTPPSGLPFAMSYAGETVFLTAATDAPSPQPLRVLDAMRFGPSEADVTLGRYPDGADNLLALSAATYGTTNAQPLVGDIVINEIMYHHGSRDERYEYIELHNKGAGAVSLDGWSFTDGITYDFNETSQVSSIPAGGYLVVAKDPALLEAAYDNLTIGVNLVGPYEGELDDHTERIRLSYPYEDPETHDVNMITVDEVTYYDGGRWPIWADGQGASLELRDPRSNNDHPDAWAASDESEKADWQQFMFTVAGSNTQYTHDSVTVFELMLLNRGDVLVDDLELIISSNRLTNAGFESGETSWRMLGNHTQSFVTTEDSHSGSRSLHVRATGHGDPGANRINQSISSVTASTVTFRGWARWLRGTPYMLLRASRETSPVQPPRPANSFELTIPMDLGTPGVQNSAYVANCGPEISGVRHDPVLPAGNEPIVVTARVTDNDGVASVTLYYRYSSPVFTSTPMLDNGMDNDLVAQDGIYTGVIPGTSAGTMYLFYVEASDGSASTRFPTMLESSADVPNRTCLVRVGDAQLNTAFATYRVWMSSEVISTFTSRANLSNELLDCTFVYNDTDVFYNVGIRFRGSPFIRSGSGRNPTSRYAWRIDFNSDQKYRDREEINMDNTEGGSRGPLQERASYWFYRKMGLEYSSQEYIRPIMNGNSYQDYEDVQKIDGDYIDSWFPGDNDGYIHKIDDYFEYTVDGTGFSNRDEGLNSGPLIKETYRWNMEKRSHREDDDWDHLFDFASAMHTSSSNGAVYEAAIESAVHPYHFAAVLAIRHAEGDWDSYGYNRGKNNYFYYAAEEDKWYLIPWDIDFTLGSGNGSSTSVYTVGGQFPEVSRFLNYSKYSNLYLQAFGALLYGPWQTSYGTANPPTAFDEFLDDAADALAADGGDAGRRDGIKIFVRDRRSWILNNYNIPAQIFEITTNGGDDFCTSDSTVTIEGVAQGEVEGIALNGSPVTATFMGSAWEVDVPLAVGANLLEFEGLDDADNPVAGATDSITATRVLPCAVTSVSPDAACNNGTAELTIHGSGFAPGSAMQVSLTGSASTEIGFDALYVQNNQAFDLIDYAAQLLDNPEEGVGDPVYAVHPVINLFQTGDEGVFSPSDQFAVPFNSGDPANFAVRFSGYIYAPSPGVRYFAVNSDDGFTLSIGGQLVGEYANPRAPATTDVTGNRTAGTMTFNFPAAGSYYLVLDFFENSGGEEIEFFQTNSSGADRKLFNVDAELIVFRDDVARVNAADVVVVDENTITCRADLSDAEPNLWTVIVTPECSQAAEVQLDDALEIVACRANFNHDSRIDFFDWAEITDNWGRACSAPLWCDGLDADRNGRIDFGEAAILADEWLLPR
ncbi:MAG TPA: lamin tail domain-containing protein, partial [Sedimentisphaerales bacterium]|nr:lamin tail domain-containing protein [Sedimentisphaerales bacterium]